MALQTVLEKLQLKDEKNILVQGLPSSIEKQFIKLSFAKSVTPLLKSRKIDLALVFAISRNQLSDILKDVVPALHEGAKLWVAYPKVASKIASDLCRDCNWDMIAAMGFETVEMTDLDNTWSAVHFKLLAVNKKTIIKINTAAYKTAAVAVEKELKTAFTRKTKNASLAS